MNEPVHTKAEDLRRAFDESFARPIVAEPERREPILIVRAQESHFALRARETLGIEKLPRITALATPVPAFMGITHARGIFVAVYDIHALVTEGVASRKGGWMALCGAEGAIGLFFDELRSYAEIPPGGFHSVSETTAGGLANEVVRVEGSNLPVLQIPALMERIERRSAIPAKGPS